MKEQLEMLAKASLDAVAEAGDIAALDALRVKYLGKKGELTVILKQMGKLVTPAIVHEINGALNRIAK